MNYGCFELSPASSGEQPQGLGLLLGTLIVARPAFARATYDKLPQKWSSGKSVHYLHLPATWSLTAYAGEHRVLSHNLGTAALFAAKLRYRIPILPLVFLFTGTGAALVYSWLRRPGGAASSVAPEL
jgi:hypothetical protein